MSTEIVYNKVNSGEMFNICSKCSMCEAIYISNTQQTFNKRMDVHFSDLLSHLKNGQKSDSFAAHF